MLLLGKKSSTCYAVADAGLTFEGIKTSEVDGFNFKDCHIPKGMEVDWAWQSQGEMWRYQAR